MGNLGGKTFITKGKRLKSRPYIPPATGGYDAYEPPLSESSRQQQQPTIVQSLVASQAIHKAAALSDDDDDDQLVDVSSNERPALQLPGQQHRYNNGWRRLMTANESSSRSMKPYQAMLTICVIAGFIQM